VPPSETIDCPTPPGSIPAELGWNHGMSLRPDGLYITPDQISLRPVPALYATSLIFLLSHKSWRVCTRDKHAKKEVARHVSIHSNASKGARIASTHSTHSTPRVHRYIGVFMERPLRSSMVNSIVFLYPNTCYTCFYLVSRVPYPFDIGLNSLTTPS
jgi:hypothetical protein